MTLVLLILVGTAGQHRCRCQTLFCTQIFETFGLNNSGKQYYGGDEQENCCK